MVHGLCRDSSVVGAAAAAGETDTAPVQYTLRKRSARRKRNCMCAAVSHFHRTVSREDRSAPSHSLRPYDNGRQDVRLGRRLPPLELKAALKENGLADPGLLSVHPRTLWKRLGRGGDERELVTGNVRVD